MNGPWLQKVWTANQGAYSHRQFLSFGHGEDCRFDICLSYPLDLLAFYENSGFLCQGALSPSGDLQGIRFSYAAGGPDGSGVAIDNVLAEIPEPAQLIRLALATVVIMALRRRNRTSASAETQV